VIVQMPTFVSPFKGSSWMIERRCSFFVVTREALVEMAAHLMAEHAERARTGAVVRERRSGSSAADRYAASRLAAFGIAPRAGGVSAVGARLVEPCAARAEMIAPRITIGNDRSWPS
jgi:hypothetical protein